MSNVTKFYPQRAAERADAVLEQAIGNFEQVVVLGHTLDGRVDARASLGLSNAELILLLEQAKSAVLEASLED